MVTEDTERTIGERRLRTLRELAARTTDEAKSAEEACQTAARILAGNPHDLPFVLLYLLDADDSGCRLAGATGLEARARRSVLCRSTCRRMTAPWPFRQVVAARKGACEVSD